MRSPVVQGSPHILQQIKHLWSLYVLTRMIVTSLVFAIVIGCGAGAYALMNPGMKEPGKQKSYISSIYGWSDHDDDHDDHDEDDD